MPQTSTVVLITKQLALATALEIDKFSKVDFREKSRVVLGHNCTLGPHLRVLEYAYHPDFNNNYYSALAMVQIKGTIRQDCSSAMVRVYKMEYVDLNECRDYYRRNDLDVESLWPKHVSCAKSLKGGSCMWRSGTVLVTKQQGKWRLLGVGVYGPGCEAPSRFLDYGRYHYWVARSIARIGKVAVTRMGPGHLILRRCKFFFYLLTLHSKSDYSCIVLRIWHKGEVTSKASLKLHKWCHSPYMMCGSANSMTIFFNVEITFEQQLEYNVRAFGREFKYIDAKRILYYLNQRKTHPPLPWDKTDALSMSSCGIDNSPVNMVYEGQAQIETYPWLGILYYPIHYKRFTTAVVLVTRQLALAAASEIERLPKDDFRARARVVLGHNCSGPHLTIRDYSYHPEYSSKTFSALTMIQLETDLSDLSENRMARVRHVKLLKSSCLSLQLGFGVYGPGCQAPSRFLDYGMYHKWVERNVQRIGRPTITTISDNHVIFRRMSGHIQRFGPCDREETVRELYSDRDAIEVAGYRNGHFSYNVSLYANVEYSCVTFRADHSSSKLKEAPKLHIQRWCAGSTGICFGFGYLSIHFRISVRFKDNFRFILRAYGQEAKIVDPRKAIEYINLKMQYPTIPYVHEVRDKMKNSAYGPYIYTV
ncbi:unnamed protein product [Arctia plantaginis]|uniref:Peptidase S1 domain-containing protein n=1 Tax=Arctia plantaginis TaxID=874455 RepID=A0A8S0Z775_ARCPL|nr:unnamed protein product [Arctia plantaginis]